MMQPAEGPGSDWDDDTSTEFSAQLNELRTNAGIPSRREVLQMLKRNMPIDLKRYITTFGDVAHASLGVIGINAEIRDGSPVVLLLSRPDAEQRIQAVHEALRALLTKLPKGAKTIVEAYPNLMATHSLADLFDTANLAVKGYEGVKIEIDGKSYQFEVPRVKYAQAGFLLTTRPRGIRLADLEDNAEKAAIGLAIATLQLSNILSGRSFANILRPQHIWVDGESITLDYTGAQLCCTPNDAQLEGAAELLKDVLSREDHSLPQFRETISSAIGFATAFLYRCKVYAALATAWDLVEKQPQDKLLAMRRAATEELHPALQSTLGESLAKVTESQEASCTISLSRPQDR